MDLKKEVEVGDYVQYVDGSGVVTGRKGIPLRIVEIFKHNEFHCVCVAYDTNEWDRLADIEKADPLLLELL